MVKDAHLKETIFQATLESVGDGILIVGKQGNVLHANNQFAKMWKIPEELLKTNDDQKLLDYVLSQLSNPESFLTKVRQLYNSMEQDLDYLDFKDGRTFNRTSSPLVINGKIAGRVWVFSDITKQKELDKKLHKYSHHLEDLIKKRTQELETKNAELIAKNKELEKYNELFVGREFRIKELKKELTNLKSKIKEDGKK